jgi:hypothetical protein
MRKTYTKKKEIAFGEIQQAVASVKFSMPFNYIGKFITLMKMKWRCKLGCNFFFDYIA